MVGCWRPQERQSLRNSVMTFADARARAEPVLPGQQLLASSQHLPHVRQVRGAGTRTP